MDGGTYSRSTQLFALGSMEWPGPQGPYEHWATFQNLLPGILLGSLLATFPGHSTWRPHPLFLSRPGGSHVSASLC